MSNQQFINSYQVKVFPTTLRTEFDPQARLTTEYNLCAIINKLVDCESFVITYNINDPIFYFNVNGYIYSIDSGSASKPAFSMIRNIAYGADSDAAFNNISITTDNKIIYAHIFIKKDEVSTSKPGGTATLKTWNQLQGIDTIDESIFTYKGLWLTSSATSLKGTNKAITRDTETLYGITFDNTEEYIIPLFECIDATNPSNINSWRIYPDSMIKFKTGLKQFNQTGADPYYKHYRSVTIDDGVL